MGYIGIPPTRYDVLMSCAFPSLKSEIIFLRRIEANRIGLNSFFEPFEQVKVMLKKEQEGRVAAAMD